MGCHLWGRTESDTTEATQQQQQGALSHFSSNITKNTNCLNPIPKDSDLNDIGHGLGIGAPTGLMGNLAQV